jgi:spore coat protein U-like protein
MKTLPIRLVALALFGCLANLPAAYAATATTTFQVTANVVATCSASATDMAFGAYSGALIDQTSAVSVTCTSTTGYTIGLDDGLNYANSTHRSMKNAGTDYLEYELYSDVAGGTRWGNVTGTWVSDTGTGSAQSHTVYGRLPAGQDLFIGTYSDTITVTVTY